MIEAFRRIAVLLMASVLAATAVLINSPVYAAAATLSQSRVSGPNRFDTALEVARLSDQNSGHAIIASSGQYADTVAATPLAGTLNAPILPTATNTLHPRVAQYLTSSKFTEVTIVGGTAAVSTKVESQLKALGLEVRRLGGSNRYQTAQQIAQQYWDLQEQAAQEQATGTPTGGNQLESVKPAPDENSVTGAKPSPTTIAGTEKLEGDSPAVDSKEVSGLALPESPVQTPGATPAVAQPEAVPSIAPTEPHTATQTAVSADIAVTARPLAATRGTPKIFLASGLNYPDALTAGVAAGNNGAVVLLAGETLDSGTLGLIKAQGGEVVAVGGAAAKAATAAGMKATAIVGSNRYKTAVLVAQKYFPTATKLLMASGQGFADALYAAAHGVRYQIPVLLTPQTFTSGHVTKYLLSRAGKVTNIKFVGGARVISDLVLQSYVNNLKGIAITPASRAAVVARFSSSAARAGVSSNRIRVSVTDTATGAVYSWGRLGASETASIVKVNILMAALLKSQDARRSLTSTQRAQARAMITRSDNNSATALYKFIGGKSGLARYNQRFGLTQTKPQNSWGTTKTTPEDQNRLLQNLVSGGPLTAKNKEYVISLMSQVISSQRWGVGNAGGYAVKNGWVPLRGPWRVNSIGLININGRTMLMSIMTTGWGSMGAGSRAVNRMAANMANDMRALTPR